MPNQPDTVPAANKCNGVTWKERRGNTNMCFIAGSEPCWVYDLDVYRERMCAVSYLNVIRNPQEPDVHFQWPNVFSAFTL